MISDMMLEALPIGPCPLPHKASQMKSCLIRFLPLMDARFATDGRGRYIAGLRSTAISARAAERHPYGTRGWLEAEAASLILAIIEADARGARRLAGLTAMEGADVEAEIVACAIAVLPAWGRQVAARRKAKLGG